MAQAHEHTQVCAAALRCCSAGLRALWCVCHTEGCMLAGVTAAHPVCTGTLSWSACKWRSAQQRRTPAQGLAPGLAELAAPASPPSAGTHAPDKDAGLPRCWPGNRQHMCIGSPLHHMGSLPSSGLGGRSAALILCAGPGPARLMLLDAGHGRQHCGCCTRAAGTMRVTAQHA